MIAGVFWRLHIGSYRLFKLCPLKTTSAMATGDDLQATHVTAFSTLLDEEGVSSEEIKRLRGSVSAFKGHLTRAFKDIRLLCSNSGPLSDIVSRKSA